MPSLTSIAEDILANAKRLDAHLSYKTVAPTSFDHDSLVDLPHDMESVRNALIDSTHTLKQLAQGPVGRTVETLFTWTDVLCLRAIYTFKLTHAVPIEGSATYQEIAQASGISESLVRRFLRHAMANRIFAEVSPGRVRHTATSRMLVKDPDFFAAVGLETAELAPAAGKFIEALTKYGDSGEQTETAFSLENDTTLSIFQYLSQRPERARRFGAGMQFFTKSEGWDLKHLASGFDWASIDRPGATVVDMGGGHGSVSQFLAKTTRHVKFIVQDLPSTVEQARVSLPSEFEGRVEFMGHDFFKEQTLQGPEVFLFRWIMHNWSDRYCVKILQNLIPAIKDGSRVLFYEYVLKDEAETKITEKIGLDLDMVMAACFNSAERTKDDWLKLLSMVDERLVFRSITRPEGSTMSIVEAVWHSS